MSFLENETFDVGCNYWASDSGVYMWRNWNEENIDNDFRLLSEIGVKTVRVFPLWSDFQPIQKMYTIRQNVGGLSVDDGRNMLTNFDDGTNEVMFQRFERMLDLAAKYGLKAVPSILTGWMSGRMFVPSFLEGVNLLTDPFAIYWEVKFINAFVNRFKHHDTVVAWCIGNECNCMGNVENRHQAWLWVHTMANAIRVADSSRPVISGMHSLVTDKEGAWVLQDNGLSCDFLTTHPYASPTYGTDKMKVNTLFPMLHPAAQTQFYKDIGKKPCFIEETGTYGQMYCDEELTAKYVKGSLYTAWSHNCLSFLWWIGFDQGSLNYYPFSYNNRASNYGLYREDKSLKPVGNVIKEFSEFQKNLPFGKLPERIKDAVCIISNDKSTWVTAYSSFILAKQARIDIDFAYLNDGIPDSDVYFLPSVSFTQDMSIDMIDNLMARVNDGAVLYLSVNMGFIRNINADFGFHLNYREKIDGNINVCIDDEKLPVYFSVQYDIDVEDAKVLATDEAGKPVFLSRDYGKGKVFFLMCPIEVYLYGRPSYYEKNYYKFYSAVKESISSRKIVDCDNILVGITEHELDCNTRICVITAYTDCDTNVKLTVKEGWFTENSTDFVLEGSETKVVIFHKN